jgi:hypothetical protein
VLDDAGTAFLVNASNKPFLLLHGCDTLIPHKYNTKLEAPKKTLSSQKRPVQELVSSGLSWYFWPWKQWPLQLSWAEVSLFTCFLVNPIG